MQAGGWESLYLFQRREPSIKKILVFIGKKEDPYRFESTSNYRRIEQECYIFTPKEIMPLYMKRCVCCCWNTISLGSQRCGGIAHTIGALSWMYTVQEGEEGDCPLQERAVGMHGAVPWGG